MLVEEFMFEDNDRTFKYYKFNYHTMIHEICLDHLFGWLVLRNHLDYAENLNAISVFSSHEYDTDILQSLLAGLQNCQYINDMKIIGSIHNSFFQFDERMIEAGLFTKDKFQAGKEELLDRMESFFERHSGAVIV